jgi:hypothetical protein
MEHQLDATITVLLISKIRSTCSGQFLPIFRSVRLGFFTAYGIVSCWCGRQGFEERQRGTTCAVWRKVFEWNNFFHNAHIVPRCRAPNPCLPQQQGTIPYAVKISVLRSWRWAKIARNRLSWSWRSINCYCCI